MHLIKYLSYHLVHKMSHENTNKTAVNQMIFILLGKKYSHFQAEATESWELLLELMKS